MKRPAKDVPDGFLKLPRRRNSIGTTLDVFASEPLQELRCQLVVVDVHHGTTNSADCHWSASATHRHGAVPSEFWKKPIPVWVEMAADSTHTVKITKTTMRDVKNYGNEGSMTENHSKMPISVVNCVRSQFRGTNARRNPWTAAVRPKRRLRIGEGCFADPKRNQKIRSALLLKLGNAGFLLEKTRLHPFGQNQKTNISWSTLEPLHTF